MCHLTKEHKLIKLGREALQIPGGEHLQLKEEVPLTTSTQATLEPNQATH